MARTLLAFLAASGMLLTAQTAEVKLDQPQVRASLVTLAAHAGLPARELPLGGVLVFLGSGEIALTVSGKTETLRFKNGDFRWIESAYSSENRTAGAVQFIEVALKAKPSGPLPAADLDPVRTDPEHYKAEFENDQVRVLRVHYGPHEKGALHEHKLNRVVCYVTDHPNLKAGSVRIAGPATHTEENAMDQPVERVAIELK